MLAMAVFRNSTKTRGLVVLHKTEWTATSLLMHLLSVKKRSLLSLHVGLQHFR